MKFYQREAMCVIGVGWILASLLGAIPFFAFSPEIGMPDAFFESASGLTTTGASVLNDLESYPPSMLFWRCMSQWIGGMGVVVFFVAVFGFVGSGAKLLYSNEASGSLVEAEESRVQKTVLRIVYLYVAISVVCSLCFRFAGMEWYEAICHTFATVSTGGFSTRSASIAAFENPAIEWIAIVFMAVCGSSFVMILRAIKGNLRFVRKNSELLAYGVFLLVFSIAIGTSLACDGTHGGYADIARASIFQVVSIMTTTGFATEDFSLWSSFSHAILLVSMMIGGSTGSTAGGLKVARLVVAFRVCLSSIERSYRRRVVRRIRLNDRVVSERFVEDTVVYILLSTLTVVSGLLALSILDGSHNLDTSMSSVLACYFNIGPGLEEVGPLGNYASYSSSAKVLLALMMILGRLELYAILALLSPSLWRSFK